MAFDVDIRLQESDCFAPSVVIIKGLSCFFRLFGFSAAHKCLEIKERRREVASAAAAFLFSLRPDTHEINRNVNR